MTKITAETTIPIQNSKKAKDATLILEGDQVQIKTPAMFSLPAVKLDDLTAAVEELQAIAAAHTQVEPDAPLDPLNVARAIEARSKLD